MKLPSIDSKFLSEVLPHSITLFALLIIVPLLSGTVDFLTASLFGYTYFYARFILSALFIFLSELFYSHGNPIKLLSAILLAFFVSALPWWAGMIIIGVLLGYRIAVGDSK